MRLRYTAFARTSFYTRVLIFVTPPLVPTPPRVSSPRRRPTTRIASDFQRGTIIRSGPVARHPQTSNGFCVTNNIISIHGDLSVESDDFCGVLCRTSEFVDFE